jgi:hopanoid biosynthesis associated protein HpnK
MPQTLETPTALKTAPGKPAQTLGLIVHADDFGLSEAVNEGILDAHLNGVLTSTSIMASADAFGHAIAIARANDTLDIGIHLTLVEERPILDPDSIPSLVDGEGRFHRHATVFAGKYFQKKISLDDVRRELDAQIRKVLATGVRVSHIDSHQHLHMLPGVLKVALELANKHGISRVRFPREAIRPYMFRKAAGLNRVAQLAALNMFCSSGKHGFPTSTEHFAGFYFGGSLNTENLLELVSHLPWSGTCELMCHPGHSDPSASRAHWGYRWPDELEAVKNADVSAALKARGIRLISWRDVPAPRAPAQDGSST